ncbi:hypothetical protein ACO1MN_14565, partial [Staphylococcus aureus]
LTRELKAKQRAKMIAPDEKTEAIIQEILKSATPRALRMQTAAPLNGGFISGCESGETSADAFINNRYNGAFTYFLLQSLHSHLTNSMINITS